MKILNLLFVLISIVLTSCAGVKFANAPVNTDLPESFTERSLYPAGVAGYNFQDLVGNVLEIKKNENPFRIGMIVPNGYKATVIPILDPNNYYKSRIQQGAELKGSYLKFAANFKADQLAELELIDIARSGIPFDTIKIFNEILEQATKWVSTHPKSDTSITRVWVKAVVLTRRIYNDMVNVGANASGQVGDVVGVSTGVYNKHETEIKSVIIAFESFDIDKFVKETTTSELKPRILMNLNNTPSIPKSAIYKGIIQGEIKIKQ